jgi:hypothetical protein
MIIIRPHHILCMHGFAGKGYSEIFTDNMKNVIEWVRKENQLQVVFSRDDICKKCPNLHEEKYCATQEKVSRLDTLTAAEFHLEERAYAYTEIVKMLKEKNVDKIIDKICMECSWYESGICKETITASLRDWHSSKL